MRTQPDFRFGSKSAKMERFAALRDRGRCWLRTGHLECRFPEFNALAMAASTTIARVKVRAREIFSAIALVLLAFGANGEDRSVPKNRRSEVIASSGTTELRLQIEVEKLELCSGERCSAFACPGYGPDGAQGALFRFKTGVPWPGRPNVALIEYFQTGSGAVPSLLKITLSKRVAACEEVEPPSPSLKVPGDQEQLWGTYVLDRTGLLKFQAGSYKKGRADACHACPADTVIRCSWDLGETGFIPRTCEMSPRIP
jgi:hypothetical protein